MAKTSFLFGGNEHSCCKSDIRDLRFNALKFVSPLDEASNSCAITSPAPE